MCRRRVDAQCATNPAVRKNFEVRHARWTRRFGDRRERTRICSLRSLRALGQVLVSRSNTERDGDEASTRISLRQVHGIGPRAADDGEYRRHPRDGADAPPGPRRSADRRTDGASARAEPRARARMSASDSATRPGNLRSESSRQRSPASTVTNDVSPLCCAQAPTSPCRTPRHTAPSHVFPTPPPTQAPTSVRLMYARANASV